MSINLLNKVAEYHPRIDGWCSLQKAQTLASIAFSLRPNIVVEVGVYCGKSAIPMALALKENGGGVIHCIDAWSPLASVAGEVKEHAEWWSKIDHEKIFQTFSANIHQFDVANRCVVHRKKSDDAEAPAVIDVLHIDGSHTSQAIKDAERFAANVRIGGICIMDDLHWVGEGVARAVDALKRLGFVELYTVDDWGVFQRVSIP
jgi:predicted O-methyltransferase YrrM